MSYILNKILKNKIVAIVRGVKPDKILQTAEALYNGGIKLLEVTFDQTSKETIEETKRSLELVAESFSDKILLGAGTVITEEQVEIAVDCGAEYIISPNTNVNVIKKTKELDKVSIPGALTPSELVTAFDEGADIIKVFPASVFGLSYVKALMGPLGYIPVVAVGGINENNIKEFLDIGVSGVGIGGNLVDLTAISNNEFNKLTTAAQKLMEKAKIENV